MKIRTAWLGELHGALGKPFLGGMNCFRTDQYGNIVGLKSPSEPRIPSGKQRLYRHQLRYWSLHWNFLTPAEKQSYADAGDIVNMTGYDFYIQENYNKEVLRVAPTDNRWVELWHPNTNPKAIEYLSMSDDPDFEDWTYVNFPLEIVAAPLSIISAAIKLRYVAEAGWGGQGKRVDCHRITEPWRESTITYNTRPALAVSETSHGNMVMMGEWISLDVTDDINSLINGSALCFGWRIKYHELDPDTESMSGWRSSQAHENDSWLYLTLEVN